MKISVCDVNDLRYFITSIVSACVGIVRLDGMEGNLVLDGPAIDSLCDSFGHDKRDYPDDYFPLPRTVVGSRRPRRGAGPRRRCGSAPVCVVRHVRRFGYAANKCTYSISLLLG